MHQVVARGSTFVAVCRQDGGAISSCVVGLVGDIAVCRHVFCCEMSQAAQAHQVSCCPGASRQATCIWSLSSVMDCGTMLDCIGSHARLNAHASFMLAAAEAGTEDSSSCCEGGGKDW